jgi:hypothetical protein
LTKDIRIIMKFSALTFLGMTALVAANETLLRFGAEADCIAIKDKDQCLSSTDGSDSCVWCECQAVPSVCVSKDQADSLPPGVFQCSSPVGEFHFVEDRVHHLKENPMGKSEICDPSSESISGYMDIKGSKYDENGEDKHLFFWMFEKRNADVEESAEEIPFVVWLTGKYVVVGVLTSRMPRCSFGGRNSYFSCDIHLACGVNILKTLIVCFAF